ncbi:hypothetical protein O3P69_018895 [Scylla paramamosain]|uniref:Uncharacterized protein n=1 Tax=Scylla paramamosain TaxID=85552 RepID=A0AAW0SDY4_SCYPA
MIRRVVTAVAGRKEHSEATPPRVPWESTGQREARRGEAREVHLECLECAFRGVLILSELVEADNKHRSSTSPEEGVHTCALLSLRTFAPVIPMTVSAEEISLKFILRRDEQIGATRTRETAGKRSIAGNDDLVHNKQFPNQTARLPVVRGTPAFSFIKTRRVLSHASCCSCSAEACVQCVQCAQRGVAACPCLPRLAAHTRPFLLQAAPLVQDGPGRQGLNEGDEKSPADPSEGEQTEWRAGVVGQWLLTLTSVNTGDGTLTCKEKGLSACGEPVSCKHHNFTAPLSPLAWLVVLHLSDTPIRDSASTRP